MEGRRRAAEAGETAAPLSGTELRDRATGGALLLGARGALILFLGVGANIALARLLVPRDFGIVALGTVLLVLGSYLAEGGLAAALIGRSDRPTQRQLEAVNGVQLAATLVLVLAFVAGSIPFGRDGLVVATMVATLPITMLKVPAMIALERNLEYREIATVDVVEAVAFYGWAVTTVALGMGVWGMATGMVARALAGTAVMARISPLGLVRPRWDWAAVRPLLGFGTRFQANLLIAIVRLQGMNVAVAAIAGVPTLGVWNLAWRVIQMPQTVFATVGRVGYPAIARLLDAGEDPRPAMERALATVAVGSGLVLVGIIGFAPALPAVVGPEWDDLSETLLGAALALVLAGPVGVVVSGYLYATDAVGTVVRFSLLQVVVTFAVTLPLLPEVGAGAIGAGWLAGSLLTLVLFARAGQRRSGARVASSLAAPTALTVAAGALGWALATVGGGSVLAGIGGVAAGELALIGGLALVRRSLLRDTYALLARSARGATAARLEAA